MKVFILNGNSEKESLSKSICAAYEEGAKKAGHIVTVLHIGDMQFDPILHEGHHIIQALEPDLVKFQENILAAKHIVIVYPTWWGGLPAILKGLFDRSFYTGFAYQYHEKDPFWDKLLKGRSAQIITTIDAPKFWYWFAYRSAGNNMLKRAILQFCGINPVKTKLLCNIRNKNHEALEKDLEGIKKMALALR